MDKIVILVKLDNIDQIGKMVKIDKTDKIVKIDKIKKNSKSVRIQNYVNFKMLASLNFPLIVIHLIVYFTTHKCKQIKISRY